MKSLKLVGALVVLLGGVIGVSSCGNTTEFDTLIKRVFHTISGRILLCDNATPNPNITVRAEGTYPHLRGKKVVHKTWNTEAVTDENGQYSVKVPHLWSGRVYPDSGSCPQYSSSNL